MASARRATPPRPPEPPDDGGAPRADDPSASEGGNGVAAPVHCDAADATPLVDEPTPAPPPIAVPDLAPCALGVRELLFLFYETTVVALPARDRLARRATVTPADLADEPLMFPSGGRGRYAARQGR